MNKFIRVQIPLDDYHRNRIIAETGKDLYIKYEIVHVKVDNETYNAYRSGQTRGLYHGIVLKDSGSFPNEYHKGANIVFLLNYRDFPTAILPGNPNGFGQKVVIDEED